MIIKATVYLLEVINFWEKQKSLCDMYAFAVDWCSTFLLYCCIWGPERRFRSIPTVNQGVFSLPILKNLDNSRSEIICIFGNWREVARLASRPRRRRRPSSLRWRGSLGVVEPRSPSLQEDSLPAEPLLGTFCYELKIFLYTLGINSLSNMWLARIFFHS